MLFSDRKRLDFTGISSKQNHGMVGGDTEHTNTGGAAADFAQPNELAYTIQYVNSAVIAAYCNQRRLRYWRYHAPQDHRSTCQAACPQFTTLVVECDD